MLSVANFSPASVFFLIEKSFEKIEQIDSLRFRVAKFIFVMSDFQKFLFSFSDQTGTLRNLGRCDNQ